MTISAQVSNGTRQGHVSTSGTTRTVPLNTGRANPDQHSALPNTGAPARAGAPGRGPQRGHWRTCVRCKNDAPLKRFPLLNDPAAKMRKLATRFWCDDCLVEQGHLPKRHLTLVHTEPRPPIEPDPDLPPEVAMRPRRQGDRAAARSEVERHALVVALFDAISDQPGLLDRLFAHKDAVDVMIAAMTALALSKEK